MSGSFKKLFAQIEQTLSFQKEKTRIDFTIELQGLMEKTSITRADLARKLNKSNAYITQILRGERNFTIDTMVELADALDSKLTIHFSSKGEKTVDWYRVVQGAQKERRKAVRASSPKFEKVDDSVFAANGISDIYHLQDVG